VAWCAPDHEASLQKHPVVCCPTGLMGLTAAYDFQLASARKQQQCCSWQWRTQRCLQPLC
jgi:hypothetical protein